MNVKKLKELIADLPDHMTVFIKQTENEYEVSPANKAEAKKVKFSDGALKATDTVLLLTD